MAETQEIRERTAAAVTTASTLPIKVAAVLVAVSTVMEVLAAVSVVMAIAVVTVKTAATTPFPCVSLRYIIDYLSGSFRHPNTDDYLCTEYMHCREVDSD